MDFWFEVALAATIFAVGNTLFGHFDRRAQGALLRVSWMDASARRSVR